MSLKETVARIPGFRELMGKFADQDEHFRRLEYGNLILAQENIDRRLRDKKARGEKVNVVFVCNRPAVWESLHSVYDALKADDLFSVTLVAVPTKAQLPKLGFRHETYEWEGADAFWKDEGCLEGCRKDTGEWLDLRSLKPDYVFFQQPYNLTRPAAYASSVVAMYAKIGYVAYFSPISIDDTYDESTPLDFLKDLSFFFTQHEDDDAFIEKRYREAGLHCCERICSGCPRFDRMERFRGMESEIWNPERKFRILWTPRWTTNEGNCHFFDYRDLLPDLVESDPDLDFVFRPHPQAFREWKATGQMPPAEQEKYRARYDGNRLHLDESGNYYPMIFSSDCLITDRSTMIVDYYCTGRPIIYCTSAGVHDEVIPGLDRGLYKAGSWQQLRELIQKLKNGEDPLKPVREEILRDYLKVGRTRAGERIRDVLRADALK